jgi:anaerobic selenocysteine-containing dehydrogenase
MPKDALLAVPVSRLYDRGNTLLPTKLLHPRLENPQVVLNPQDAEKLGLDMGTSARVTLNGTTTIVSAKIDNSLPAGTALIPRSLGIPILGPTAAKVEAGG